MKAVNVAKLGGSSLFEKLRKQSILWLDARYGSGSTFVDRSPLGLSYSIVGATWIDRSALRVLNFDGIDDQCAGQTADKDLVSAHLNDHTVVLGLKADAVTPSQTEYIIICRSTSGNLGGYCINRSSGSALLYTKFCDGTATWIVTSHTLTNWSDGNNHLVFAQFDRDANEQMALDTGNWTAGGSIAAQPGDVINQYNMRIGLYSVNNGFTGDIFFVALFNKLLSLSERTLLYSKLVR